MAGFILCRSKCGSTPYYNSSIDAKIYSLEELCYYIYNNIYMISPDFIDEGLIQYIDKELEEKELANQLTFLISKKVGLSELIIVILQYVDYYSPSEIMQLKDVLRKLDSQNDIQILKARADNFLNNRRYKAAIERYDMIINGKTDNSLTPKFYGDVWHNMGVANAGLFLFDEAKDCFDIAYKLNHNEESLKASKTAEFMQNDCHIDNEENYETDELLKEVCHDVESLMKRAPSQEEYFEIRKALSKKKEGNIKECYDMLDELVIKWKSEYRKYIK